MPPFPIAPINEVRKVLDYAVSVMPREKILMGIPLYGYDWKLPFVKDVSVAEMISPQEAVSRASRFGSVISYTTLYQSPIYRYTDKTGSVHEVWFEDARSIQIKYNTIH